MEVTVNIPEDDYEIPLPNEMRQESQETKCDDQRSKKEIYKIQFRQALESLTIRGLSRAFKNTKRKYQVYWIFVFVVGLAIFSVNFYGITKRFVSGSILTQLEREGKPFTWPHFTLCSPSNPIPFWTDPKLISKWKSVLNKAENYSLPTYSPKRNLSIIQKFVSMSTINPSEFYSNVINGSIFKLFVYYEASSIASFSGAKDRASFVKDYERVLDVRLYTIFSPIACITLVTERLKEVVKELKSKTHRLIGIKLHLIMDLKSYMTCDIGDEDRKMYLYVTWPHSTIISLPPYYIQPGTSSEFHLNQKIRSRVAHCTSQRFKFYLFDVDLVTAWPFEGGFEDCRKFLSQKKCVSQCGCYNPYLPMYKLPDKEPILCTNMTLFNNMNMSKNIDCLNDVLRNNYQSEIFKKELHQYCNPYYLEPCNESWYSVTVFKSTWQNKISPSMEKHIMRQKHFLPNAPPNATSEFPRENSAIVKLRWGKEKPLATFDEFAYPLSRYMSNLGGLLVLWIGLNVFCVFEILEIIYKFIKYKRAKN